MQIPAIGLGTWPLNDSEAGVEEGIRRSGLPRDKVFVTTKLNKKWHSYDGVHRAFEASTAELAALTALDVGAPLDLDPRSFGH